METRRRNLDALLSEDKRLYLSENKKETKEWFNALGRSTPFGGTKFGLVRSISTSGEKVNGTLQLKSATELAREVKELKKERRALAGSGGEKCLFPDIFPCGYSAFVIYCTYITYIHCGFADAAASAETPCGSYKRKWRTYEE